MKIYPETKTISEIYPIENDIKYIIPPYQRNYSWNNTNIEEFYNDINNEDVGYYIGNFITTENSNEKNALDIIDGQQRLTTIALFLLAIYEEINYLKEKNTISNNTLLEEATGIRVDIKRKLICKDSKVRIKLLKPDANIFKNYLRVLNGEEKGKFGNKIFGKRYKYIQSLFRNTDEEFNDTENLNKIIQFYKKLNSVELLRINVDNITDAFSVFTSLNAKGVPLTLIDLLKSYYLGQSTKEGIDEEESLELWDELINVFTPDQGEPNSKAISQFLQNNYDAFESQNTSSITKKQSLYAYERLFSIKKHNYINELLINAKLFSLIVPKIDRSDILNLDKDTLKNLEKIAKLEASPVYPIILYLLKMIYEKKLDEKVFFEISNYLVNFYIRRNLTLKPKSSNIRSRALQVVRKYEKTEDSLNENSLNILKDTFKDIKPSDDEFKYALESSVYDISPITVRLILIDLERSNGNYFDKQNIDNLDDRNQNGNLIWTLEHILPQNENLSNTWKEMISPDNIELANAEQMEYKHKLGNLTLTGYNSELSDKDFIIKRDYKSKESGNFTGLRTNLYINKSLADDSKNEDITSKNQWTKEDIIRRTELLSQDILKLYHLD